MQVWLVGRIRHPDRWLEWEAQGIYGSEAAADAACTRLFDFYMPLTLDAPPTDAITANPAGRFPRWTEALPPADQARIEGLYARMTAWYQAHEGTDPP